MLNKKGQVKRFWENRAIIDDISRSESRVNFKDAKLVDSYIESEISVISTEFALNENDILVDLGAGNGRWALYFAPKVSKVTAVEYIKSFTNDIVKLAVERGFNNIEVINESSENFYRLNYADVIFVSGLLIYLDEEQYKNTLDNISKTVKQGGRLFMRETISVLKNEFIVDKYSEELGADYFSIYRTNEQHIEALKLRGFILQKSKPFFEDGSILNNRIETRLYYFIFIKKHDQ